MKRAFTFVELLVCLSIMVIMAACLTPVLRNAKQATERDITIEHFRQLYTAISIYSTDWDGAGQYGDYARMGLPPDTRVLALPKEVWHSGCPPIQPPGGFRTMWHPDPDPTAGDWTQYALNERGNAVLLGDDNCDFNPEDHLNPLTKHRGIGLYAAGQIRIIVRYNTSFDYEWWNP